MNNLLKVGLSLVVIVLSIFILFRGLRPPTGSTENHVYAGARVGRELARLRGDAGGKVLVIGFSGERRVMNQQIEGFLAEIGRSAALQVVGRENIDPDALGEGVIMEGGGVPPSALADCLVGHADADIVVSFVGLPDLRQPRLAERMAKGMKLVILNASAPDLADLVSQGRIYLAVVNRNPDMSQFTKKPASPEAWFDRFFELVSAETPAPK